MTAEAEVQEQTNLPQDVRPSETLTPILAQGENQDLSTPAVEFRNVHFFFDDGNVPDRTQHFALICEDPDAPSGVFTHWLLYNLPVGSRELEENVPKDAVLAIGASHGD
jgi:phosphatidylethanolamine-binding protein (PEBP) family uncharacterized protein